MPAHNPSDATAHPSGGAGGGPGAGAGLDRRPDLGGQNDALEALAGRVAPSPSEANVAHISGPQRNVTDLHATVTLDAYDSQSGSK